MTYFWQQLDDVLRGSPRLTAAARRGTVRQLLACVLLFGVLYGAAMGTFPLFGGAGWHDGRGWQVVYSALKVPLLLLVTFGLSLPSFFVLNTLLGVRDDFMHALRALAATQAALAVILAALGPFTVLWYASSGVYQSAILVNALMFAVAALTSQRLLRRWYRPLLERDPRHRPLLRLWLFFYGFIGLQMAWLLRPFVGDPGHSATFLRSDGWGNAYDVLGRMIWRALVG